MSEMYARLVLRCEEHVKNSDEGTKLPYDVLRRRLQQLQALYDGPEGANIYKSVFFGSCMDLFINISALL